MKINVKLVLSVATFVAMGVTADAQNPIVQTNYTADPAPMVHNGRLYLYTSHDEDDATWFTMNNWKLYSTDDMVNWTDYGVVLSYSDFEWGKSDAWAAQCVERNGKFYLYVPMISKTNNRGAIGVAVADSPTGPFYDPLGKPLVQSEWGDIDPTAFVDTDGQAYLYWGNPKLRCVKLNEDMISYSGSIIDVPMTEESFGKREGNPERPTLYEEGPWLYKRDKKYYLFWPGGPLPEHIGYSMSDNPMGPWKYGGTIMSSKDGAFTNHPGVIDFKGKTYFFYHNAGLPGGGGFNRSVCVEELLFDKKGNVIPLKKTKEGIKEGVATLCPYRKNEAETIAWSEGIKASQNKKVGVFVTAKSDSAYIKVRNVDFRSKGAGRFTARVGTTHNGGVTMEIRTDSKNGPLLGTVKVPLTGGNDRWRLVTTEIVPVSGVKDIYFVCRGKAPKNIMFFDYWIFSE